MVYFLLVFIGMVISGVFVIKSLEIYNLGVVNNRIDDISEFMLPGLKEFKNFEEQKPEVSVLLDNYKSIGLREEVYVIDVNNRLIATTSENAGPDAVSKLKFALLRGGISGKKMEDNVATEAGGKTYKTQDKVFPIVREDTQKVTGVLYVRYDLAEIYNNLDHSKTIIVQATILALFITVLMGFFIAKNITEPINDVTSKASKMANGDFDQHVDIKSDDEIGKLGEMFNYLTRELKISMSQISSEKSKLEAIINYMDDGLIAVDIEGKIIHLNTKARLMLEADIDAEHFDELIFKFNPNFSFLRIINASEEWFGSSHMYKDESIYRVTYAPFMNDREEKAGIVFVLQDITEQEKLDKMRREFVANVSHELKTPLTSIKSYTETILDGGVEDEEMRREFLTVVNVEADRMARLVKDLLLLSNFDSQKESLELEFHDYLDLLKKTVKKVDVTARAKNHSLKFIADEDSLVGYFDYDRIEQVVLNILTNAIKYTPDGGKISVYASRNGDDVTIRVTDTGLGIPQEDLSRIFERFYRVDKARSRELGGTGLGLAIAREIVEAHKGTIQISSVVDSGTTVDIRIPMDVI